MRIAFACDCGMEIAQELRVVPQQPDGSPYSEPRKLLDMQRQMMIAVRDSPGLCN